MQGYHCLKFFMKNKYIDYEDFPVLSNHICNLLHGLRAKVFIMNNIII